MTHARSATHWRHVTDRHGRTVRYVVSNECTVQSVGLCSVHDPMSDLPSRRMVRTADGWIKRDLDPDCDGPYPEIGLIVYGTSKFDRPGLDEAHDLDKVAADAIAAAV